MSKMIRINPSTSETLNDLAKTTNQTRQRIVEEAVELLSRTLFLKKTNREYDVLKKDNKLTQELESELQDWDTTLLDGLENE